MSLPPIQCTACAVVIEVGPTHGRCPSCGLEERLETIEAEAEAALIEAASSAIARLDRDRRARKALPPRQRFAFKL
ncbi:MAG: hypothetical protein AAGI34_06155 [Pseudomonadota bacterium]